ncbi:hypothetical protein HOLleu_17845 [Holothuria leucospilota]|uniref:C2H2-type domain-containing protein n=1 Tax=Holothuria leucospilota TaxID=206669 RepID=A0A9Q1C1V8_HOLLE|nr:hypothetical protein HOLleu_17845 [Holothuria leucospilota]
MLLIPSRDKTPKLPHRYDELDDIVEMAFMCSLCPKEFKLKHHLKRHVAGVHIKDRKHVCKTCQKEFSRRDNLLRHQRKHEGRERGQTCNLCEKLFFRKHNLKKHMKIHGKKKDQTKPECACWKG